MPKMMTSQQAAKFYLGQTEQYLSESKDELLPIAEMHRAHARNAARRLLLDAETWYAETGGAEFGRNTDLWMMSRPLFRALVAHGGIR